MDDEQLAQLAALAPSVDEDASLALFQRRRARRRTAERATHLAVALLLLIVAARAMTSIGTARTGPNRDLVVTGPAAPQPDDVAHARADVVAAIEAAHDGSLTIEQRDRAVADAAGLAAIANQVLERYGAAAELVRADDVTVDFTSATTAVVHFELVSRSGTFPVVGGSVLTPAGWKMTRATRCAELARAGMSCP